MLIDYILSFFDYQPIINLLRYNTFRAFGAFISAFFIGIILFPVFIKKISTYAQPIRELGPETHKAKSGTPTLGGLAIVLIVDLAALLWCEFSNNFIIILLAVLNSFMLIGLFDDLKKIFKKNHHGISWRIKLFLQSGVAIIAVFFIEIYTPVQHQSILYFPFLKNLFLYLGFMYIIFGAFVVVGTSNAVNLTDGLDGLVTIPLVVSLSSFALISYIVGSSKFANYLQIPFIEQSDELLVYCSAIIGSLLAFLWFNSSPAEIFMGDTGSLSLGATLGSIAVIVKHEIMLTIIGGIFVLETLSVIIQVYYFRLSKGKRIFRMAPIHHHFEKLGIPETKVVARFWIVSIILAVIGLASLKIR